MHVALVGATVGKLILGLRIERDGDGARPGWWQSTVRAMVFSALPVSLVGVALPAIAQPLTLLTTLWMLIIVVSVSPTPSNEVFHGKAAGTAVVRR